MVKVAVEEGQQVSAGDLVVVLEAMKMENPVTAHKDGTITGLAVEAGAAITRARSWPKSSSLVAERSLPLEISQIFRTVRNVRRGRMQLVGRHEAALGQ